MGALKAARRCGRSFAADVRLKGDIAIEGSGGSSSSTSTSSEIFEHVASKGFCVIDAGIPSELLEQALAEVRAAGNDLQGGFIRPTAAVQAGLLGREASVLVAELQSSGAATSAEDVAREQSALEQLDAKMTDVVWNSEVDFATYLSADRRSPAMLHINSTAVGDEPLSMTDEQVSQWLSFFRSSRLTVCIFLGPSIGILELRLEQDSRAELVELRTAPGMMVILKPHLVGHAHIPSGRSVVLTTCFGLHPKMSSSLTWKSGAVQQLEQQQKKRLHEIRVAQEKDTVKHVSQEWEALLKHELFAGQTIAVRGVSCRVPSAWDTARWITGLVGGLDAATVVPNVRWNHVEDVYDPEPDSYLRRKAFTKHGCFMDNIALFDNQRFSISVNEARAMDPNQRFILEMSYEVLVDSGLDKESMFEKTCGVYVGLASSEWVMAPQDAAPRSAPYRATGDSSSIAGNRVSYALGLRGPSMTIDTEQASSLTAIHTAAESVLSKGRNVPCPFSVACGVSLLLNPYWWPNACANGWLSRDGRTKPFDAGADGYIRADAGGAVVLKAMQGDSDGLHSVDEDEPETFYGLIAGSMVNNSGRASSLSAPDILAEQEVMMDATRAAGLRVGDIDAVETIATGIRLHDAIEASATCRALQPQHLSSEQEDAPPGLVFTALKGGMGHSSDASGVQSFVKTLTSIYYQSLTPGLHLRTLNPSLLNSGSTGCQIISECLSYRMQSAFVFTKARGFGGVNVAMIGWNRGWQVHERILIENMEKGADGAAGLIQSWPGGWKPLSEGDGEDDTKMG